MNTPQPLDPRDLRTCRACGHVFSRTLGTCPNCGALRDHRRKHKKSQRLRDRFDRAVYEWKKRFLRYKWYVVYIGGGALVAMVIHPTAMFLAEFSRPPGWRDSRWEAGWSLAHFFEPFVAAGETLWRWASRAVVGAVTWIGEGISWLLMAKPSLVFAAVVGGGIGAVLAWRRTRRRRKHRHRQRSQGTAPSAGAPVASSSRTAPPPHLSDDWEEDPETTPPVRPLPRPSSPVDRAPSAGLNPAAKPVESPIGSDARTNPSARSSLPASAGHRPAVAVRPRQNDVPADE